LLLGQQPLPGGLDDHQPDQVALRPDPDPRPGPPVFLSLHLPLALETQAVCCQLEPAPAPCPRFPVGEDQPVAGPPAGDRCQSPDFVEALDAVLFLNQPEQAEGAVPQAIEADPFAFPRFPALLSLGAELPGKALPVARQLEPAFAVDG